MKTILVSLLVFFLIYIQGYSQCTLNASVTFTNLSCNDRSDGTITVTASGGAGNYTYSNDSGTTYQASNIFVNLAPGAYAVTAKDMNGCAADTQLVTIMQPAPVTVSV